MGGKCIKNIDVANHADMKLHDNNNIKSKDHASFDFDIAMNEMMNDGAISAREHKYDTFFSKNSTGKSNNGTLKSSISNCQEKKESKKNSIKESGLSDDLQQDEKINKIIMDSNIEIKKEQIKEIVDKINGKRRKNSKKRLG